MVQCIATLATAMASDFGYKFKSAFSVLPGGKSEELRLYKNRLYGLLKGRPVEAVYEGYALFFETAPEWPPGIPQLVGFVEQAEQALKNEKRRQAEAEQYTALPAPAMTVNVMGLLAQAKAKTEAREPESQEARRERLAALLQNHNAVLALHGRDIQSRAMADHHRCAYGGCGRFGVISNSTRGDGNFYCGQHWRQ